MNKTEKAFTLWITGLPCSGKTTISLLLKKRMEKEGIKPVHLDGDEIRSGINCNLGFSEEDKKENLRRVSHICKLFNKQGIIVIASFVSPTNDLRKMIKEIIGNVKFVFVKCSLEECERRDEKGMYKKARNGEIPDFIGIQALFEEPKHADIVVDTEKEDKETSANRIFNAIRGDLR